MVCINCKLFFREGELERYGHGISFSTLQTNAPTLEARSFYCERRWSGGHKGVLSNGRKIPYAIQRRVITGQFAWSVENSFAHKFHHQMQDRIAQPKTAKEVN